MQQKQEKIVDMFNDIAPTYDRANRILSMGIDIKWRQKACDLTYKNYNQKIVPKIVDVACGTGDMMGHWDLRAKKAGIEVTNIVGVDPSTNMMEVGKKKFPQFTFIKSEAKELPFEDGEVDIVSISYGIRNVIERQKAINEFHRILKKDGYVVILEFTKDEDENFFYKIRDFYVQKILPIIGGIISKNIEAYTYLPNSIGSFVSTQGLCDELAKSGFEVVFCKGFSMNISTLFIAKKL